MGKFPISFSRQGWLQYYISISLGTLQVSINPLLLLVSAIMCCFGFVVKYYIAFAAIALHELGHMLTAAVTGNKIYHLKILPMGFNAVIGERSCCTPCLNNLCKNFPGMH